jgi:phage I-like protein
MSKDRQKRTRINRRANTHLYPYFRRSSFCKRFAQVCKAILHQSPIKQRPAWALSANEAIGTFFDSDVPVVANSFTLENEGDLIIPFGDWPGEACITRDGVLERCKVLQRFDATAAAAMIRAMNSMRGRLMKAFGGYPVYIGHPDLAGSKDADTKSYGWIKNASITPEGMRLQVKWSTPGLSLITNAHYKYHSPYWLLKDTSEKTPGGIPICSPVALISVGLTNNPRIPVPASANELEKIELATLTNQEEETDMNLLQRLIALINNDDITSEDDVFGFVSQAIEALKKIREAAEARWKAEDVAWETAANTMQLDQIVTKLFDEADQALSVAGNEISQKLDAVTEAANSKDQTITALRAEVDALTIHRDTRIKDILDAAISEGRILAANRADFEARFFEDFDATAVAVANAAPQMNTQSALTDGLPNRQPDADPAKEFVHAVNSRIAETGETWPIAWNETMTTHSELYASMHHPERTFTEENK